jgi:hypothetical protein
MNSTLRHAGVALASLAAVVAGTVLTAPPAHADAGTCLAQLVGPAANTDRLIIYPAEQAKVRLTTSAYTEKTCYEYSVALGISRTDLSGFLYANAHDNRWYHTGNYFFADFVLPPNQPGTWMTRQIAVKDRTGKVAIRQFTAADSPTKVVIKRESFLTGTPHGTAITHTYITSHLQAWSSVGTMANLPNQLVQLQVSRPGANHYVTIYQGRTDRYGWWRRFVSWTGFSGYDVRLAYYSPYQTIASDWHYLGRVA